MGQVPGEIVAAASGCFNPKVVVPAVAAGWQIASREAHPRCSSARCDQMLRRVLGSHPGAWLGSAPWEAATGGREIRTGP